MKIFLNLIFTLILANQIFSVEVLDRNKENLKCTEFKDIIETDILLHVPCLFIRLMEHLQKCPNKVYYQTLVDIRCSEKCTSGYIKKKIIGIKDRIVLNSQNSVEIRRQKQIAKAKKIMSALTSAPANLSYTVNENDCLAFANALKIYFDDKLDIYGIRKSIIQNSKSCDASVPLDGAKIEKSIDTFRCMEEFKSDISHYHYYKYLVSSLKNLTLNSMKESEKSKKSLPLSESDIIQLFYPYVEMNDRYNRILPSQSYLAYFFDHYDELFLKPDPCGDKKFIKDSSESKKSIKNFFKKDKKSKKEEE